MPLATCHCDVLIIGGGFYGLYLADFLAARSGRVVLCEQGAAPMRRASYSNQARVHNGYHYPRSFLTAVRSRVNFPRFTAEFPAAIRSSFKKVYAISRRGSKVTAAQFVESMRRIGASIRPAPAPIASLFDPAYIEATFLAEEVAFDAVRLCELLTARAERSGVELRLETKVRAVRSAGASAAGEHRLEVDLETPHGESTITARNVFCCGYAQLNAPGAASGLPPIPLKHELTEMALVEVPAELQGLGITVMDGPFFSLMPFPARGLHTLSHVRYTPHAHWFDGAGEYRAAYDALETAARRTAYPHMVRDAARYLPSIARSVHRDSLWEVKTVLPRSEADDSRPILFRPDHGLAGYHLVMGGKIDNVYDVVDEVAHTLDGLRK